jgi:calcineurin-like phosphoesterase family protein
MVENWNKVVKPIDRVYHLGDVTMSAKASAFEIFRRLNGKKVLIKGNHDLAKLSVYAEHFDDVRGSHQFDGLILTHIPIHPDSLARWGANVHGHTHANSVKKTQGQKDPRYVCVSVEQINYTPISLEQTKLKIKEQQSV